MVVCNVGLKCSSHLKSLQTLPALPGEKGKGSDQGGVIIRAIDLRGSFS